MTEADAVYAFFAAFAVTALLTPLTARLARRVGAVDQPKERGLGAGSTPLLGGLAVLGGVLVSSAIFLDFGGATARLGNDQLLPNINIARTAQAVPFYNVVDTTRVAAAPHHATNNPAREGPTKRDP